GDKDAIHKPAHGSRSIFSDPDQQSPPRWMRFVVRVRLAFQVGLEHLAAFRRIHHLYKFRQRLRHGFTGKIENSLAIKHQFDAAAKFGPKFDLASDGALRGLAGQASIENKRIGKLHRLTHWKDLGYTMVA